MLENLQEFITDSGGKFLQVLDKGGEVVVSHFKENAELPEVFETEYKTLKPGFYQLRIAETKTSHGNAAKKKSFRIGSGETEQKTQTSKGMDYEQLQAFKNSAIQEGYEKAKREELEKKVDKILLWIEMATPIISNLKDEQDGDEDGDFLTKTTELASTAVSIGKTFKDFKL